MNTIEDAQHTLVKRSHKATPEFVHVTEAAQIIYKCVLFVVKHVPLLEIVPDVFPEWYFTGECDPQESYIEHCEHFYQQVEEECVIPTISLNQGQFVKCSSARIVGEWIDAKIDNGWRHIRIPRDSVVVLTPEISASHEADLIARYECAIIHNIG